MSINGIKLLRLTSGEDIITELDESNRLLTMINPVVLVAMPGGRPGDPPQIGFAPWMPYAKEHSSSKRIFEIDEKYVQIKCDARDEFVTQYKAIIMKLDLPMPPKLIIPGAR